MAGIDLGLLAVVASAAAFATSGPFAKALLVTGWSPGALVLARVGIGGLLLLGPAWSAARSANVGRATLRRSMPVVLGYGAVSVAVVQFAYFNAVQRLAIGVALLLEFLGIVLVVLWVWLRTGRRPGRSTQVGAGLALSGLVFVLDLPGSVTLDAVGVAWGLLAAVGLATYFLLSARLDTGLPAVTLASLGLLVGALILAVVGGVGLLPLAATTTEVTISGVRLPWWTAVVELCVVAAAAAYLLGAVGARRVGSTVASFVGLTEVLFAVALAWLLLGELPTMTQRDVPRQVGHP